MIKLYKYRPYSELLYKELFYSELYFSSYTELNDPLDLSVRIDFSPRNEQEIDHLLFLILKNNTIHSSDTVRDRLYGKNFTELHVFYNNKEVKTNFRNKLFINLTASGANEFISFDFVEKQINILSMEFGLSFNTELFKNELRRLSNVFFEKSYTTCFSETYSDFLMWSHYAGKHAGICLEFTLDTEGVFPYMFHYNRKLDREKLYEDSTEWELKAFSFWDKIYKIEYQDTPPTINFYDFSPVFANEDDCDLMGLSKSKWHGFAHELEKVFSIKTTPWKYEKEWRAIEINFGKQKIPEERVRQYPVEILSGVYFGIRTSEEVKSRVYRILSKKNSGIKYYEAQLTNERDLEFNEWEYYEE